MQQAAHPIAPQLPDVPSTGSSGTGIILIDRFLQAIADLPLQGEERSFKMAPDSLLEARYLAGVAKADISAQRLSAVCTELGMPPHQWQALQAKLPNADSLHFGYELGSDGVLFKVYLEFWSRLNHALAERPAAPALPDPVELHQAFKWELSHEAVSDTAGVSARHKVASRSAIAQYRCYPGLPIAATLERMRGLYKDVSAPASLAVAEGIIGLASRQTREPLMYLEVSEEGNPRTSFDVRLYAAGLQVSDVQPWLQRASSEFGIVQEQFDACFSKERGRHLAHLSGGVDRHGREFLTLYHAAR